MITTQTREIDLDDLEAVRAAVAKANKKAAKIGVPGYVIHEGAHGVRDITAPDPFNPGSWKVIGHVETVEVSVLGEAPKYAGWTFVATIDWVGDNAVIRKVAGLDHVDTTSARDGLEPNGCDHCHAARDRKNTYLLRSDSGEFKQVGSTCLREFLGVEVNLSLLGFNPYEGCDSTNRYAPDFYLTLRALEDTLAVIRQFGWTSASAAYNNPALTATKAHLLAAYSPEPDIRRGQETHAGEVRRAIREQAEPGDAERAVAILNWVRNTLPGNSDYALNLKAAVGEDRDRFQAGHLGVVISAVEGYRRWETKEEAKTAERVSLKDSGYVGAVGDRLRGLVLEVRSARWIEGLYGSTLIVLFSDANGNAYKWFASNPPRSLETVGTKVQVTGTVKKHEEFNGLKSTVLTRCGVKEVVTA